MTKCVEEKDHPRLRGEKGCIAVKMRLHGGSPPLTRGKEGGGSVGMPIDGITPAYAGKSRTYGDLVHIAWDHPRLRGEKLSRSCIKACSRGSPPLTRGKERRLARKRRLYGITPAYAGKRSAKKKKQQSLKDHPRLRGEKPQERQSKNPAKGSPPLTRGKGFLVAIIGVLARITPAYAGKSSLFDLVYCNPEDHPRLRGEKSFLFSSLFFFVGSPPLTRGKVTAICFVMAFFRITPAYAGKSGFTPERGDLK